MTKSAVSWKSAFLMENFIFCAKQLLTTFSKISIIAIKFGKILITSVAMGCYLKILMKKGIESRINLVIHTTKCRIINYLLVYLCLHNLTENPANIF